MPFKAPLDPLLLLRLADRGIFHVAGEGDGNISVMEKEPRGTASKSTPASGAVWSGGGDTKSSNPTRVAGLFESVTCGTSLSIVSFEDLGVIEVASKRVGISLTLGTMLRGDSWRFIKPFAFRFCADPSLTSCKGLDLR